MTIPKFRAWHKKEKAMYEVAALCFTNVSAYELVRPFEAYAWIYKKDAINCHSREALDKLELMQWTGLTFKGVDLYYGDIIRDKSWCPIEKETVNIYIIGWNNEFCGFRVFDLHEDIDKADGDMMCWLTSDRHEIEIIGNIYENPELLENV